MPRGMSAGGLRRSAVVLALMVVVVFGAARPTLTTTVSGRVAGGHGGGRAADVLSWTLVAVGVAAVLALLSVLRWRRRHVDEEQPHEQVLPPTQLDRVVGLLVVLFVFGTLGAAGWWAVRVGAQLPSAPLPSLSGADTPSTPSAAHPVLGPPQPADGGMRVVVFLLLIGGAALTILVAALLVRRRRRAPEPVTSPPSSSVLAAAVVEGRFALRSADTDRAAILACYQAMEQSLADHGVAREGADTATEHLRRAMDAGVVRPDAVSELLAVFHRARFSDHPVRADDRETAQRVLADVSSQLAEARCAPG